MLNLAKYGENYDNILQQKPAESLAVKVLMAKPTYKITVPMARTSVLWMLGENFDKVQKNAPDLLTKFPKSFLNEVGFPLGTE